MKIRKTIIIAAILIILLIIIGSMTGGTNNNNTTTKINATTTDNFTYYGPDTLAGKTDTYAIEVNNTVYYIGQDTDSKLAEYSTNFASIYNWDLKKYDATPDAVIVRPGKLVPSLVYTKGEDDLSEFTFGNDKNFSFEYKTGETVGANKNASVITHLYYPNGTEM